MDVVFFFNDTATTEIYTLSLHDALPIFLREGRMCEHPTCVERRRAHAHPRRLPRSGGRARRGCRRGRGGGVRGSGEHPSGIQSRQYLVCRLLLEKKNKPARKRRERT